jgi:hypothetical protein
MAGISIKLNQEFVKFARSIGKIENRSAPKQIEFWAKVGRIAMENPDLNYEMIRDILIGKAQVDAGELEPYIFGKMPP